VFTLRMFKKFISVPNTYSTVLLRIRIMRLAAYRLWLNINGFFYTVEGFSFKIMVKHVFKINQELIKFFHIIGS
jgi:hypothetical protein